MCLPKAFINGYRKLKIQYESKKTKSTFIIKSITRPPCYTSLCFNGLIISRYLPLFLLKCLFSLFPLQLLPYYKFCFIRLVHVFKYIKDIIKGVKLFEKVKLGNVVNQK